MAGKSPQKFAPIYVNICAGLFTFVGFPEPTLFTSRQKGKAPH